MSNAVPLETSGRKQEILTDIFGFSDFRPGQEDIIDSALAGKNLLALMPTGAGKSLCYQLPALLQNGLTIVVSPLIALMDNQLAQLKGIGAPAGAIHSGRPRNDAIADWRKAVSGDLRLLYMSPERLMAPRMQNALSPMSIDRFVIDEAHCISQWGHDFRPEYMALSTLRKSFPATPISAFTATADQETRAEILQRLVGNDAQYYVHGFDRPNIDIAVADKNGGKTQLIPIIKDFAGQQGIVYCLSRKETEEVAELLRENGVNAMAYHAGLSLEERSARLNEFLTAQDLVIVATVAFGMGIDKPDIRFVVHYSVPASLEAYYQEIGRAGRDGAPARALLLYSAADIQRRRRMAANGEDGPRRANLQRLEDLAALCEGTVCRRQSLLAYFGETIAPCGACDICRAPPQMSDATDAARKVIDAVEQSGELFGAAFIVDILRGANTQKIRDRQINHLPAYGTGADRDANHWRSVIRQMTATGLLKQDREFGGLALTRKAREERFTVTLHIRDAPKHHAGRRKARSSPPLSDIDSALFAALKTKRLELAKDKNVPAYAIFSDRTLIDMAKRQPANYEEFADVFGVGAAKLKAFADDFLGVINTGAAGEQDMRPKAWPS